MTEQEITQRAKDYIDKLANGINPLTGEAVDENDIVNNVRIARCLFYVSGILEQVIEKGLGKKRERGAKSNKQPFSLTDEQLKNLEYSDTPISVTAFVQRVNRLIESPDIRRLSYKDVQHWLVSEGMLEPADGRYGSAKLCPTEYGSQLGMEIEKRTGPYHTYYCVFYDRRAQEFIAAHLSDISKYADELRLNPAKEVNYDGEQEE